jgi:large subunit ribosomal protein L25
MSSDKITLTLEERTTLGKKVATLRQEGNVPAVVYGHGFDPINAMAPGPIMEKVYASAGKHHPVHLTVGGKARIAMIKSADFDPVKHRLRHLSFHAVKQNETVKTEIPIVLQGLGESPAERAGLIVLTTLETVNVAARPGDLVDSIEARVDHLTEVGDHLTVADLTIPEGVEIENDPEQVIASVYEPSALAAANEAAGGDAEDDASQVDAANGEDTDQESQAEEDQPGGKKQFEPKGQ